MTLSTQSMFSRASQQMQDLQAAINGAANGATITITGTCTGNYTVTGKTLTLTTAARSPRAPFRQAVARS